MIMAASPLAKKKYGLSNVMRARDLPPKDQAPDLMLVEPHMNLYIKRSMEVLQIFRKYAADEDIHVYSIDESMIDMTESWHLFGDDPYLVARKIQKDIHDSLGLRDWGEPPFGQAGHGHFRQAPDFDDCLLALY